MPASKPHSAHSMVLVFLFILHLATTGLSWIWLLRWMGSDGALSGGDITLSLALAVSLLIALYSLSHFGVEEVPKLKCRLMVVGLTVGVGAAVMFGVTSGMTSAATLSNTRGYVIHHETFLREVSTAFSERGNLIRSVEGLQHALANCKQTALDAREKELQGGEISKDGGGDGKTARELKSIADQCESAGSIIVHARSTTAPLFKQEDRLMEEIRRTTENPAISFREKDEVLIKGSERISAIQDELIAAMSLASLDSVTEILMRDYAYIGLSGDAVQYIESTFRPIARQILVVIDEAAYTLDRPFPQFKKRDSLELLTLYPGQLWPSLTFAAILEGVPLIIVGFSILMSLQRREHAPEPDRSVRYTDEDHTAEVDEEDDGAPSPHRRRRRPNRRRD